MTSNLFPNQILTISFDVIVQSIPEDSAQLSQFTDLLSISSIVLSGLLLVLFVAFTLYFRERIRNKKLESSTPVSESAGVIIYSFVTGNS